MASTRVWHLVSETGTPTECRVDHDDGGVHQLTILHNGSVAALETYTSAMQARWRAWELNRALVARGWSEEPDAGAAT